MWRSLFLYLLLGLIVGAISGSIGIGGGVLLTPALVYIFGFSQHNAQGTTLALLVPPVSLLAAWTYYEQGYVNIAATSWVFVGFFVGGFFGAKLAATISDVWLHRIFGVAMFIIAVTIILSPST
jgi:uncharacterized membrane protein YfcA